MRAIRCSKLKCLLSFTGEWGRYHGLHVRKDLAEAFLGQKPSIIRLGGSMTNADGFRFKYVNGARRIEPSTIPYGVMRDARCVMRDVWFVREMVV